VPSDAPVQVPASTVDFPQIAISFDVGPGVVTAGDDLHGQARLTNLGADPIRFLTSPTLVAGVRRPGDDYMAGQFRGWITAAGVLVDLAEGRSRELHLIIGTASCQRDSSKAISPGTYEIVAALGVDFRGPDGAPTGHQVLVRFGPSITVTASAERT
jgi:hypothetical protein